LSLQGELAEWRKTPEGSLAEVLILDQFREALKKKLNAIDNFFKYIILGTGTVAYFVL
jgi:hypothetical protein